MTLLKINDLTVTFTPRHQASFNAVSNLSFEIKRGESLALVGESGSGKSITSLSIMGLLPNLAKISHGSIKFDQQDIAELAEEDLRRIRGRKIAMIFQDPMTSLNPLVKVGKQIAEPIHIHMGLDWKDANNKAFKLLEKVALRPASDFFNKYPHQLSGGEQQRIMIAMAVSAEPDLLIADEPTTALDVTIQKQVIKLLTQIQKEMNMSLLFITHDLALVSNVADRIGVMRNGKLIEIGSKKDIFKNPKKNYTKSLLLCRPNMNESLNRLPTIDNLIPPKNILDEAKSKGASDSNILTVENISLSYGHLSFLNWKKRAEKIAINDVSLQIPSGRNFGIVGESGCGKTSLARVMACLTKPTSGQVFFKGQSTNKLNTQEKLAMRRKIQYIFQNPYAALNPRFTIEQILCEPMEIHHIGENKLIRRNIAEKLMDQVGLKTSWLSRYPHEFSGGQRQRICIARALTLNPELIICDESVSALDVSIQAQILNLLLDLQDEYGMTYIFISHDLAVVKFFCDDVAVMKDGQIVEQGNAEKVYTNPVNPFTKHLLASIPQIEAELPL